MASQILVVGTKVVLTKTKIKKGQTSAFEVGEKRSGTLSDDYQIGKPIYFEERNGGHVTSEISSCKEKDGKIILETRTSIYDVRVVKNDTDKEFHEWLNW